MALAMVKSPLEGFCYLDCFQGSIADLLCLPFLSSEIGEFSSWKDRASGHANAYKLRQDAPQLHQPHCHPYQTWLHLLAICEATGQCSSLQMTKWLQK